MGIYVAKSNAIKKHLVFYRRHIFIIVSYFFKESYLLFYFFLSFKKTLTEIVVKFYSAKWLKPLGREIYCFWNFCIIPQILCYNLFVCGWQRRTSLDKGIYG